MDRRKGCTFIWSDLLSDRDLRPAQFELVPGPGSGSPWSVDPYYQTYINPVLQNIASEEAKGNVSEDCLTVDIYIPRNSTRQKMGILYWIHGGGYQSGDVQELA